MVSFHVAALVGALVILMAAAGVFVWLPARPGDEPPARTGADGDLPSASTDAVHGGAPVLPDDLVGERA
jgi:hypothetical protein